MTTTNTSKIFAEIDNAVAWDQDFTVQAEAGQYTIETHGTAQQWTGGDYGTDHDRNVKGTVVL